ncbi:MFS general substrate transporter [Aulographum hederae CBS 113979]|uniref:MFS general substrate transporter n=1 Tax=Aulographum hederae CBS 113979 TaxID=1176131 RepID=A0A6G1GSQ4_9PEZI|nr:MFS general substrate transporter [Aulographum hederae CBS 113979]
MPILGIPNYIPTTLLISLGGFLNGYDTGSIGSITEMPLFATSISPLSPLLRGFAVSLIMLTGAVPSFLAGGVAERLGRLQVVFGGAVLFVVWEQFYGLLGHWKRLPFIIQASVAIVLAASCLLLPQSPRWLIHHGRREQAIKELARLDFSLIEAERDILRPVAEAQEAPALGAWQSLRLCFRRGYRARTSLALWTLGMVQLCGIDGVLYYAPTLFAQAGLPSQQASFLASGASSILILAISIPALIFADRFGRRLSINIGGVLLSGCMLLIGSLYAADSVHSYGNARWVVIVSIFVFALTYSATWGIVSRIYASEILPAHTRASANSLAQGLSFFTNWLVAIITPVFLANSSFGAYFLFGFLSLTTVSVLYLFMPETRGQSLEIIQEAFARPVARSWMAIRREEGNEVANPAPASSARGSLDSVAGTRVGGLRVETTA